MDLPRLAQELLRTGLPGRLFEIARDEDLGSVGDVSSLVSIDPGSVIIASLAARQRGVLAGLAFAQALADRVAPGVVIEPVANDADRVSRGDKVATVRGPARSVLAIERPVLNLIGRLSGIATLTAQAVEMTRPARTQVCDTRKTTPGLRVLEKYAVVCGGGTSHRMGLYDAVMLKDNHLAAMRRGGESLESAIERAARDARARMADALRFVQVECDTIEQFEAVLRVPAGLVDLVLLDNMSPDTLRQAVALRGDRPIGLEASGGITIETLAQVAATGIDRVSLGQLTTQATGIDFGLDHETTVTTRAQEPPLQDWADAIEQRAGEDYAVMVVSQTASTQDLARPMAGGGRGAIVVAGQQTAGRGRLGRAWTDGRGCGLAISVYPRPKAGSSSTELLGIVGGLALCAAARSLVPSADDSTIQLRWPNDAVHTASGRKLGGVLVEQVRVAAQGQGGAGGPVIGLGLNVGQVATRGDWTEELTGRAVSLAELGASCHRLDAAVVVIGHLLELLALTPTEIVERARAANALLGKRRAFLHNNQRHEGTVGSIDPSGSIELTLDDATTIKLPAASTSMVHDDA